MPMFLLDRPRYPTRAQLAEQHRWAGQMSEDPLAQMLLKNAGTIGRASRETWRLQHFCVQSLLKRIQG